MSKKVLIVDDHPLICQAIAQALAPIGFETVGETADGVDALRMIATLAPDVVILDIGLEKLDGLSVLRRITREKLATRVLIFTAQAKENYAARCLQAGASGFVSKSEPIGKLIKALETVADGYVFFPRDAMPLLGKPEFNGDLEDLTDRELQVFKLLAALEGERPLSVGNWGETGGYTDGRRRDYMCSSLPKNIWIWL